MHPTAEKKPKRQLTDSQLEKLKLAREKALEKRRELAAMRKMERDIELKEQEEKRAEIKAKHSKLVEPAAPVPEPTETESEPDSPPPVVKKKKPKKKAKKPIVIVEESESSSSDDEQANVVYVKRRSKKTQQPAAVQAAAPSVGFYGQGFARRAYFP